jgi:hypothetical protein
VLLPCLLAFSCKPYSPSLTRSLNHPPRKPCSLHLSFHSLIHCSTDRPGPRHRICLPTYDRAHTTRPKHPSNYDWPHPVFRCHIHTFITDTHWQQVNSNRFAPPTICSADRLIFHYDSSHKAPYIAATYKGTPDTSCHRPALFKPLFSHILQILPAIPPSTDALIATRKQTVARPRQ